MAKRKCILLFIILLMSLPSIAQNLSTKKKKAIEWYTMADNYRVRGQYGQAVQLLSQALEKDSDFFEAWVRLGLTFKMSRNYTRAAQAFEQALIHNPENKPLTRIYYELGEAYLKLGKYKQAEENLNNFLAANPGNQEAVDDAKNMLESIAFATNNRAVADSLDIKPVGGGVNSFVMQYFPVLTADENTMIYTRRLGTSPQDDENLVISKRTEGQPWGRPENLSPNINSGLNEGTPTISADGKQLIFTSCHGRETIGKCDLYISTKKGENWSKPVNIGEPVNSRYWDSQPALSSDGRTLFFVSNRPGGYGEVDIYYSQKNLEGEWSEPVNAGPVINTPGNETAPFIHANNRTLYFSSDHHQGFGGYDIFYSEWLGKQNFSEPKNIGAPINTSEDQVSIFIAADGEHGYYSHESYTDEKRKSEIYIFDVPESFRPEIISNYVSGIITDKVTGKPLQASVELIDIEKEELINLVYSDSINGDYLIVLPEGSQYALYVNKEEYLFESKAFDYTDETKHEPVEINFELVKVKEGSKSVLNNIFFDFDSYDIRKESITELNKLITFLKANPGTRIEIGGHTDNKGSDEYNLNLSNKRAKAVYDYLIKEGIPEAQVNYRGYGSSQPRVDNISEENRQLNRRIEFTIL